MQAPASWKTRTPVAKWAICAAKYRHDDAQRSATRFVISYFSSVKQPMTKGEKINKIMTSLRLLTLLLPPSGSGLCNQHVTWTRLPEFHTRPYLVSRISLSRNSRIIQSPLFPPPLSSQISPHVMSCSGFLLFKGRLMMPEMTTCHQRGIFPTEKTSICLVAPLLPLTTF